MRAVLVALLLVACELDRRAPVDASAAAVQVRDLGPSRVCDVPGSCGCCCFVWCRYDGRFYSSPDAADYCEEWTRACDACKRGEWDAGAECLKPIQLTPRERTRS